MGPRLCNVQELHRRHSDEIKGKGDTRQMQGRLGRLGRCRRLLGRCREDRKDAEDAGKTQGMQGKHCNE